MFDASVAAWDMKRAYDSIRPVTAIPLLLNGKQIRSWGGPGKGTVEMNGSRWVPYQLATFPSPPSPDYVSEQSAYGAAGAFIVSSWTRNDRFGDSVKILPGSSIIEPGITPSKGIDLKWKTFTGAAEDAVCLNAMLELIFGAQIWRDVR